MNYRIFTLLAALIIGVISSKAHALETNGTASVQILQQIVASETRALRFGTVVTDARNGALTIAPNGNIQANGGVDTTDNAEPAQFVATGAPNSSVNISFQETNLSGAGEPMVLTDLSHDAGNTPAFNEKGALTFNVGARLNTNTAQKSGAYSGTYQVSIDYP